MFDQFREMLRPENSEKSVNNHEPTDQGDQDRPHGNPDVMGDHNDQAYSKRASA